MLGAAALCAGGWLIGGVGARARRRVRRAVGGGDAGARPPAALADAAGAGGAHGRGRAGRRDRGRARGRRCGGGGGAERHRARRGGAPRAAGAIALGEPTADALERLRARAGGGPFDAIVAALLLQRDAGGPLATLLRGLGDSLAEGVRLADDARAATAQARFTAVLVAVLPLGAAGLAELGHPGYLAGLLGSPLTAWLGGCAVVLQVASFVAVRRIARVRA